MPAHKRQADDELQRMIEIRKRKNREKELSEINDFIRVVTHAYNHADSVGRLEAELASSGLKRKKKALREMR